MSSESIPEESIELNPLSEMERKLKEIKETPNSFNTLAIGENRVNFKSNFLKFGTYSYIKKGKDEDSPKNIERKAAIFDAILEHNPRDQEKKMLGIIWPLGLSPTAFEALIYCMKRNEIDSLINKSFKCFNTVNRNYKWVPINGDFK